MNMSTTTYLQFAQLIDSALPIGSFSHSFGLESFVQTSRVNSKEQLKQYIEAQLKSSLIPFDANLIKQTYLLLQLEQYDEVYKLNQKCIAQKLARETREATCKMGKRLMKLGLTLFPNANLNIFEQYVLKRNLNCSHTIVFTWICYHLGIPLQLCIHGYLYTAIQGFINSGLRLISLGQTDGQQLISELQQFAHAQWLQHEQLQLNEAYSFSFVQDILAMEHEQLYSRLFMS